MIDKLGRIIKQPFAQFTPTAMIRYFMYLPLNFIPVVGTVMFVVLQGKRAGPLAHARYFQLKGWGRREKEKHVEAYRGAYTGYVMPCSNLKGEMGRELILSRFGVAAVLFELIPVAGIFFAFSNTVGAALWAADLERGEVSREGTSPALREKAKNAE